MDLAGRVDHATDVPASPAVGMGLIAVRFCRLGLAAEHRVASRQDSGPRRRDVRTKGLAPCARARK
eukprot:5593137-Pyramimonas_sp.AAC.1